MLSTYDRIIFWSNFVAGEVLVVKKSFNMKRGIAITGVLGTVVAAGAAYAAVRFEETTAPGAMIGSVPVGGLNKEQAAFRLRQWWETEKLKEIQLKVPGSDKVYTDRASKLGIRLDDVASVEQLEFRDMWQTVQDSVQRTSNGKKVQPVFKFDESAIKPLKKFVTENVKPRTPAKVVMQGNRIIRTPEIATYSLKTEDIDDVLLQALAVGTPQELPLIETDKKVPDDQLNRIVGVLSEFTTKFSEGNAPRSSNIRLAASKIHGMVLAPGEVFSFNDTVGRRTPQAGFKVAGVFKNGKADFDVGGGICQVSTTLYNAALLGDIKIASRRCHSQPVPYVPLGRDATVDYGNVDFKIENNYDFPIAINASVSNGSITFRILGVPQPDLEVEILRSGERSWGAKTVTVKDPSLPAGKTKVVEKGVSGRAISTWRVVKRGGKVVRKDSFGESYYPGTRQVVAVGTAKPAVANTAENDVAIP